MVKAPFTVAFGTTRRVNWNGTVSVEGVRYSVPHQLVDTRVWVRFQGDDLIVTTVGETGPAEVARHARSTPGTPSIKDELATYSDWKGLSRPARWPIRSVLESSARSAVTEGLEAVPANTTTVKPETRLLLMLDFAGGVVNARLTAMTAGPGEYLTAWEVAGAGAELGIWAGR